MNCQRSITLLIFAVSLTLISGCSNQAGTKKDGIVNVEAAESRKMMAEP